MTHAVTIPVAPAQPVTVDRESRRLGFRLTLPAQILVLFISVFPLLMQLYISVTDWSPLDGVGWWDAWRSWNTFANYADLMSDNRFWAALGRTALVMVVCVPVEFLLGFALALLFMDDFRGKRVFYSILLMPMMVVPAVAGYMFFMLFQSGGPVNDIISRLTGTTVTLAWLSSPEWALLAVIIADIWQWTPLMFLILLAGLQAIPKDLYEAAEMDGTRPARVFWRITLPLLMPNLLVVFVLVLIRAVQIFDEIYVLTGGGPGTSTLYLTQYIYETGFATQLRNPGLAAAASILMGAVLIVLTLIQLGLSRSGDKKRART